METLDDVNPTRLSKRSQGCPLTDWEKKEEIEEDHRKIKEIVLGKFLK